MTNTETEIIKKAYTYGYPVVGMYELLHSQVLNPTTRTAGFNEFYHTASVASPKTSFIPAPNNDTTYSRAWLDLRYGPVIVEIPDMQDRYYSIQLLDLFSETVINIGKRLNGTKAQKAAVVGPDWTGDAPENMQLIHCNTTFAIAFLRILINPDDNIEVIKKIQQEFRLLPSSSYSKQNSGASSVNHLPPYDTSDSLCFFKTLNAVLALTPMLSQDTEILSEMAEIGIGPGLSDGALLQLPKEKIDSACDLALEEIAQGGMQFGEEVNFWRIARRGIGNYGTDYFQRSVVWHKGALANQPEESLYPSTFQDSDGQFLDGENTYQLHFPKDEIPPVSQFWSLTMYLMHNALLVENEINRYSIGDRTKGLVFDKNGGLTIYIQNKIPETEEQKANWLPAPKEKFLLTLRLYGPDESAISGKWQPPAVQKTNRTLGNDFES